MFDRPGHAASAACILEHLQEGGQCPCYCTAEASDVYILCIMICVASDPEGCRGKGQRAREYAKVQKYSMAQSIGRKSGRDSTLTRGIV